MMVKTGQQWSGLIVCRDATGALSTPSVGPAGTLYVDGVSNAAAVTISGANPYKWTVTLPALTAGQTVSLYITATISLIATAAVVAEATADTERVSDLTDEVLGTGAGLTALGDTRLANLDATVSSRLAAASYSAAPAASAVADAVWDEALAGHAVAGSAGAALSAAGGGSVTVNATVAISAAQAAAVASGRLAIRSYHSWSQAITSTSTAALNTASKVWLAIKSDDDDADSAALAFIEKTAGLTVLAKAAYGTAAHGTLVVSGSSGAWVITLTLDEVATGLLHNYAAAGWPTEVKALIGTDTVPIWDGKTTISKGIVKTVS